MKIVKEVKAQARHPVQLAVLAWWVLACLGQMVFGAPKGAVAIEPSTQFMLLLLLLVSSTVCLVGSLINDVILGFAFELWGWVGICVLFLIYGWMIVALSDTLQTAMTAVIFPAFIFGGAWRILQIRRAQRRLKQIEHHEIEPPP